MGRNRARHGRVRAGASSIPMQVVSVPVTVRPSFVVPVSFNLTNAGQVNLPSFIRLRAWRVTSLQATFSSVDRAVATISLYAATGGSGTVIQDVSLQTRPLVVTAGNIELKIRNGSRVQHGITDASVLTPRLLDVSGSNINLTGVIYVSVLGAV